MQSIAARLEKLTPAKLGFTNPGSLATFQSNLRRALRLAGMTVMPGRHQEPLHAPWRDLARQAQAQDVGFLWPAMSRFIHNLSARDIGPGEVDETVFSRFGHELRTTCLGCKADRRSG